jgi:hypothetical protein
MFVTLKDGSHGEITLAEAQRIAMDIDAEEKEYVRLNLSKVLGPEMASIPPVVASFTDMWRSLREEYGEEKAMRKIMNDLNNGVIVIDTTGGARH